MTKKPQKLIVSFAVATPNGIRIYTSDGKYATYPATEYNTADIYMYCSLPSNKNKEGYYDVNLEDYIKKDSSISSKIFQFVEYTVHKLRSVFDSKTNTTHSEEKHQHPITETDQYEDSSTEEQKKTKVVIGDVELDNAEGLKKYYYKAKNFQTSDGFNKFMLRLAKVAKERKHSAEDLLTFLNNHDMPITATGNFLAFKFVKKVNNTGKYVDNYTNKIEQHVGDLVKMAPNFVDQDRNQSCSYGLHIASKDYLKNYGGNLNNNTLYELLLVTVNPEDVMAVPKGEAEKVRVSAYHILDTLSLETRKNILRGQEKYLTREDMNKIAKYVSRRSQPVWGNTIEVDKFGNLLSKEEPKTNNKEPKVSDTKLKGFKVENVYVDELSKEEDATFEALLDKEVEKNCILADYKAGMGIKALAKKYKRGDKTISKMVHAANIFRK